MLMELPQTPIVEVSTTSGKGHDVGNSSHPVIQAQAEAFRDQVYTVVLHFMKAAIKSDRTTLTGVFESNQQKEMAEIIRRL